MHNDKTYKTNPLKPRVGKNIIKEGNVVGNCCESFNPVTEDNKDAETNNELGLDNSQHKKIYQEKDNSHPDTYFFPELGHHVVVGYDYNY